METDIDDAAPDGAAAEGAAVEGPAAEGAGIAGVPPQRLAAIVARAIGLPDDSDAVSLLTVEASTIPYPIGTVSA